eukprot:206342_1
MDSNNHAGDNLLSNNDNMSFSKCVNLAHFLCWTCVVLDLFVMPMLTWLLVLTLFTLYATKPCGCYGFINAVDTTISNVGICDSLISGWRASEDFSWSKKTYYCWDVSRDKSTWHPQYCRGSYGAFLCTVAVFSLFLFPQYMLCLLSWMVLIGHCFASVILRILWVMYCTVRIILYFLWYCINMQIKCNDLRQFSAQIWENDAWIKDFNCSAIKRTFRKYIWDIYAAAPTSKSWSQYNMQIIFVSRILNLFPWLLLLIFIVVVPINNDELNKFNCDKYGEQWTGDPFELRINSYWNTWLKSHLLFWCIVADVVLIPLMFAYRRVILCILETNCPNFESDARQHFYLRMIGKKKKK